MIFGETSSTGAPHPFPGSPVRPRVCPHISVWAQESPIVRTYFAEITSLRGDHEAATRLDAPLRALHEALFLEANPIPVKWAMAQRGLIQSGLRLPLTELSEPFRARVRAALAIAEGLEPLSQAKTA